MKKWIVALLLFSACNPFQILSSDEKKELRQKERCNRKLERLKRKCPILLDTVKIEIPITVKVDSQAISNTFRQNEDLSGLDTILQDFGRKVDSITSSGGTLDNSTISTLSSNLGKYILTRPCIPDTIRIDSTFQIMIDEKPIEVRVNISAYQDEEGVIHLGAVMPTQEFKTETKTEIPVVTEADLTLKEQIYLFLKGAWWWIVIILILVVFGKTIYKGLKAYFPFLP